MDGKKKKSRKMQIMRVYRNTIRKAGSMVWSFDRKFFLVNFFFVCIQGVIPAVRIFFLKEIVNFIQQNEKNINIILSYVIIYIFMDFCDEIIETLYLHYNAKFELEFSNHVNILMLKKAGKLQIKNFEDTETYDIISRAQAQSGNNILNFITSIEEMGKQIVRIISMALILINFRVWIVLIIMIVPIWRNVIVIHIDQEWYKLRMKRTNEERKNRYINYLMMTGNAFKEILLHGLSDYLINKYKIRAEQIIEDDKVMQRKIVLLSLASDFIDGLITGSIFCTL